VILKQKQFHATMKARKEQSRSRREAVSDFYKLREQSKTGKTRHIYFYIRL